MKWKHEIQDGLKVITSDIGYIVRDLYEPLPNEDNKELISPYGLHVCTGKYYSSLQRYAETHKHTL